MTWRERHCTHRRVPYTEGGKIRLRRERSLCCAPSFLLFTIKIEGAKLFSFGVEASSFFLSSSPFFVALFSRSCSRETRGGKDWRLMETFARQLDEEQGGRRRSPFIFFPTAYPHRIPRRSRSINWDKLWEIAWNPAFRQRDRMERGRREDDSAGHRPFANLIWYPQIARDSPIFRTGKHYVCYLIFNEIFSLFKPSLLSTAVS